MDDRADGRASAHLFSTQVLLLVQGCYYLLTGVWPIVNRRSFELVTGPKTDFWLVRTVGALVMAIGASLAVAGARRSASPEARTLALASAAAFAAVDVNYVARGRISRVYLLDAATEAVIVGCWLRVLRERGAVTR